MATTMPLRVRPIDRPDVTDTVTAIAAGLAGEQRDALGDLLAYVMRLEHALDSLNAWTAVPDDVPGVYATYVRDDAGPDGWALESVRPL